MIKFSMRTVGRALGVSWVILGSVADSSAFTGPYSNPYYKTRPIFHFYPAHDVARYGIDCVGPIGIGLELRQPAFTMHLTHVEPGTPAAATGKLQPGQIIKSMNGHVLKDRDPRIVLGDIITEAEAGDGVIRMMVQEGPDAPAREVIVTIPALGAYSDTWPLDCPKSDRIVSNFADFLARHPRGHGAALFLLSTGEEKHLEVVREWFSGRNPSVGGYPWDIGYTGIALCEYYLRTGDESVLPQIVAAADYLKRTIYNGSWMGRGGANYHYMAGGHMNAAGVPSLAFLLLAKECGVDVDEHTMQSSLYHFYRYAGHLNVSYGDGFPERGGVDNGKNGKLAFAMAAAASLSPAGETSVYARARDISANKSFYTTSWLFHGHTGGGIGELWRGAAAGLLHDKRPEMYRSFMNERRWMYELARRHDGAFGWASGQNVGRYTTTGHHGGRAWGNYVPLVYTVPRRKLRIFGAPPTEHSHHYELPARPWGTGADEVFYSLEPGEYKPGSRQDLSKESVPTHAAMAILGRLGDADTSDDELLMFAHHPDCTSRATAAQNIAAHDRRHLVVPLLKSADPRGRWTGLEAALAAWPQAEDRRFALTDEVLEILSDMIRDPDESYWVMIPALRLLERAPVSKVATLADRLAYWLEHEDWWLRHSALTAVRSLAVDKRYFRQFLPIVGEMVRANTRAVALQPLGGIVEALQQAEPDVQVLALEELSRAYAQYPHEFHAPGGQNLTSNVEYMINGIAGNLAGIPGGFDTLYEVSRERFPDQVLPHRNLYMGAPAERFGPKTAAALGPIVNDFLIPQYVAAGNNVDQLRAEASSEAFGGRPAMPGLVALYNRLGIDDYDWRDFGPDLGEIEWDYHSYDPPEERIWEPGFRYREVSDPEGMAGWQNPGFDARKAGWRTGHAPFGQLDGRIPDAHWSSCTAPFCRCGNPLKTLWENEVLLLRTRLRLPAFQEGHLYRLCVGGMSHVQGGDGFDVFINGKPVFRRTAGVGMRQGGQPVAILLTRDLWAEFDGEVTIAARGFLPVPGGRHSPGVRRQHFSIFLQAMKAPTITEEMHARGRLLQPLLSSAWQASRDHVDRFQHDGVFAPNTAVVGEWMAVGQVALMDEFGPDADLAAAGRPDMERLSLQADGRTADELLFWSGDTLMDLHKNEARKLQVRTMGDADYLLVESGGFGNQHPEEWTSPWTVMRRVE